ncbi:MULTISPECIES: hypothetical protein [unclassified Undibacterium]|uniref:hypothetical protein n=1 Tax=unclassified Undibacterium TaxID=2630295 RepID=UPI002AC8FB40|nr:MULTISPECIES: hypothetical protein [unclassified Undibacterium]MEB0140910.1 hypothetical protein [Undibacterium sp. CCC2.1]MEB0173886.1 hypothetical protein [Undibacterium sp. CCC1.1]MEB0176595.1 hypothetical protein [Undibacterium sp. CCC3.4]MEB0217069.1 hypothetical protein [Undibacterium sp. 5I2]WPX44573.1 hypothetical protein RHM61_04915 [Undibacterium sp. CCC3.4]
MGQYKKLQLALALAAPVALLLLDEPLNGLDRPAIEHFTHTLNAKQSCHDQIIVMSSHFIGELHVSRTMEIAPLY